MKKHNLLKVSLVSSAILGLGLLGSGITASAHSYSDTEHALQTAPNGLDPNQLSMSGYGKGNSTRKMNITQNGKDRNILRLTGIGCGSDHKVGTYFSNDKTFNYNIDQNIGMWVYTGNNGRSSQAGDGMAFVLQNDADGSRAVGSRKYGESMGVYGTDQKWTGDNRDTAKDAIQNSWALEFDTHSNNDKETGDGFDRVDDESVRNNQHIAASYPGTGDDHVTYNEHSVNWIGLEHFRAITHQGTITNGNDGWLSSGKWHHVSLKWDASAKTMTYTVDDKANQNGVSVVNPMTQTVKVDTNRFNSKDGLLHWGFTAANGGDSQNNMIVMENQPKPEEDKTQLTASESFVNSNNESILGTTIQAIKPADTATKYYETVNLDFKDGKEIAPTLKMQNKNQQNINYTAGTLTMTDANGTQTSRELNANDISSLNAGNSINLDKLNKDNNHASLKLTANFSSSFAATDKMARVLTNFSSTPVIDDGNNNVIVNGGNGLTPMSFTLNVASTN